MAVELANDRSSPRDDELLELPVDFHRTSHTATRSESYAFELCMPNDVAAGASDNGASRETRTLHAHLHAPHLLTAAFAIMLARWTGQQEITLRVSLWSGMHRREPPTVLHLQTSLESTCRGIIAQIEAALGGSIASSNANANAKANAIEIVAGSKANADAAELHLAAVQSGAAAGFRATFVYDAGIFRAESIKRFAGHLQTILAGARAALDVGIGQLPLLTTAERRALDEICIGRRSTSTALASDRSATAKELVHERIEHAARATPNAIALRHRQQCLTYRELNQRANRLARYLVEVRGIGRECPVVVCVEPGPEILIALLAILKAGGVYVPLDPSYPAARLRAIADDTQPKVVITQSHLAPRLAPLFDAHTILPLDDAAETRTRIECFSDDNLDRRDIDHEQTAYIYYTSGTTGTPKGVMASQANLTSYVRLARERYAFCEADVVPAIARFSFSISMFELLTPLSAGATVIVLDREHVLDPARMSRTLAEEGVTLFHAGPSLLKSVLPYIRQHYSGDFAPFSRVRHASSGGDMVPPQILEALKEIFESAEVFVIYGCSEISCMGCTYPVPRDRTIDRTFVGRPFDDMIVHVMDHAQNVLPIGMVGEVHFAGSGLVKGYLNRPELTEEKFVTREGRRFYRTGDMGRISETGALELVGRSDFQIKIRGMRVELAEVEHHLRTAPGVRDGVVMARLNASGEKVLVAYVVVAAAPTVADNANDTTTPWGTHKTNIRKHMADHVPDYMVPSIYVKLTSLPLNHNMKLDRRALPNDVARDDDDDGSEPQGSSTNGREDNNRDPQTPNERLLATLWRELLNVKNVSLDHNFFELGGDSLLGLQLVVAVEHKLGIVLDGMDVLREPLEVLGRICDERLGGKGHVTAASSSARGCRRNLSSVPSRSGSVRPLHFGPDQSLYGILYEPSGMRGANSDGIGSAASPTPDAVLICPPVGQEDVRTHFVLGQLAQHLAARRGVPVLRFDYFGCGNSLGESHEATCSRWQRDVSSAYEELQRRTGAVRIRAIGVRLGAALLSNAIVASSSSSARYGRGGLDFERLVLWDPVCNGEGYVASLKRNHRHYLRATEHGWWWRLRRLTSARKEPLTRTRTRTRTRITELLGATYSDTMLRELASLRVVPLMDAAIKRVLPPVKWLATTPADGQRAWFQKLREPCLGRRAAPEDRHRMETLANIECSWDDAAHVKSILPDAGITTALATMTMDSEVHH